MLTKPVNRGIINFAVEEQQRVVRVAQLDRASGYGPEGREFESCHVHEKKHLHKAGAFFVFIFCLLLQGRRNLSFA